MDADYVFLTCDVPPQVNGAELARFEEIGAVAQTGASLMVLVPFILQIGLKGAMPIDCRPLTVLLPISLTPRNRAGIGPWATCATTWPPGSAWSDGSSA